MIMSTLSTPGGDFDDVVDRNAPVGHDVQLPDVDRAPEGSALGVLLERGSLCLNGRFLFLGLGGGFLLLQLGDFRVVVGLDLVLNCLQPGLHTPGECR